MDNPSVFLRLQIDFSCLECVLGLGLSVHLKSCSEIVEVSLGVCLEFELHVTLVLFQVFEVLSLQALMLDFLFLKLVGDVFDLELD